MQPGLDGIGVIQIDRGKPLQLKDANGRHLSVIKGTVWVTQQADPHDPVLDAGETFRFDRDGLALITPLGGPARVVLEGEHLDASHGIAGKILLRLVAITGTLGRALRRRHTARELHSLSDHMLRDVGLRRDQIDCVVKSLPC